MQISMNPIYKRIQVLTALSILVILGGCNAADPVITDEVTYVETIHEWQHQRIERLKSKNGWLNLAGLFWIDEGENSFGSDPENDIVNSGKGR